MTRPDLLDAEWLWQVHLGRRPKPEEAQAALDAAAGEPEALRRIAGTHPEALKRSPHTPPPPAGSFFSWRSGAPRVLILSNCQAQNLARALLGVCARPLSIMALDVTNFARDRDAFLRAAAGADIILTAATRAPEFAEIAAATLRETTRAEVVGHVPLHFTGLFPDITYLLPRGQRLASPIGDYNSGIVVRSYLRGDTPEECLASFTEENFAALGYFEQFEAARDEWRRREERLVPGDPTLREWFLEHVLEQPLLYSVNHPTSVMLVESARRLCARLGLPVRDGSDHVYPTTFSFGAIWPILPALAGKLGLGYSTAHVYSNNTAMMDAEEFVWRSYLLYPTYDRALLEEAASARGITWERA